MRVFIRYKLKLILFLFSTLCSTPASLAQIGVGYNEEYVKQNFIGEDHGQEVLFRCPKPLIASGVAHHDIGREFVSEEVRGITGFIGLYCSTVRIRPDRVVEVKRVTEGDTPDVAAKKYELVEPELLQGHCRPKWPIIGALGGHFRRTESGRVWPSTTGVLCDTPILEEEIGDWITIGLTSGYFFSAGIKETNGYHDLYRGICRGPDFLHFVAFAPQYGEYGYEGVVVYCAELQQARLSAALLFSNFGWDKTFGGSGWRVDLTMDGALLKNEYGHSGANKTPFSSLEANLEGVFQGEHEEFVWPNTGYGARISQRPADIPERTFLVDGDCFQGMEIKLREDKSCSITVTGLPDLSVSLSTPSEPYKHVGQTQNITVAATNLGAAALAPADKYALKLTVPSGWTAQTVEGCTVSGQTVTCPIAKSIAASNSYGAEGERVSFTIPLIVNSDSSSGSYPIVASLDRSAPDGDDNPANNDYDTQNDQASGTLELQKLPTLTLRKTTHNGVGAFTFTGNNGWKSQTLTTTEQGISVRGEAQNLSEASVETTISETLPPNWVLDDVVCLGMGEGGSVKHDKNSFTLSPEAVAPDSDVQCSIINQKVVLKSSKTSNLEDGQGVQAGGTITYTLSTVVSGAATTQDLVLTDTLGAGLDFESVLNPGPFQADTSGEPDLVFKLPAGTAEGTHSVTYTAKVRADAGTTVTNSATASVGSCDPCETSIPLVSLSSSKASDIGNSAGVQAGDTITYTLTTEVSGGKTSQDMLLKDTLGEGLDFGRLIDAGPFQADVSDARAPSFKLPAGTAAGMHKVTYTAKVRADASTTVSNSVTADSGECSPCATSNPLLTISSTKTSDVEADEGVQAGDTITYTLTTEVSGGDTARAMVLSDTLGSGLDFGRVVDAGPFVIDTSEAPSLSFSLPRGTKEGTYRVRYTATVRADATGTVSNRVTADAGSCNACATSHPVVRLKTSKASDLGENTGVQAGDTITYTLTTEVTEKATTRALLLKDTLGKGLAFGRIVDAGPFTTDTSDAPVLSFSLPAGSAVGTHRVTYTAVVQANASGTVSNSVTADAGECSPCTLSNSLVGLKTSKSSDVGNSESVGPGDTITYTLTTEVSGNATTRDLLLEDTLGDGLDFDRIVDAGKFVSDTTGAPKLSFKLPAGTTAGSYAVTYRATVRSDAEDSVSNSASANAGECDPCSTSSSLFTLKTSKSSDVGNGTGVQAGDTITYTLSTEVSGGKTSRSLVVTDTLGDGLTFDRVIDKGVFEIDASDAPVLTFRLPAGTEAGTYRASYRATVDADAKDRVTNTATAELGDCSPCKITNSLVMLNTSKSSDVGDGGNVEAGDTITYTLSSEVTGDKTTQDLVLSDTLGAGLAFGRVVDAGPFVPDTSARPVVSFRLPAGTAPGIYRASYTATVSDDASGALLNTVRVSNGTCSPCATQHHLPGNVTISKSLSNESGEVSGVAEPGERLTYEIVLTNVGGEITDFSLLDRLDANMSFVEASDGGSYSDGRVSWSGLTVPAHRDGVDGKKTVTVEVEVAEALSEAAEAIVNLAKQTEAEDPDCPSEQCVVLPVRFPEIGLSITGEFVDLDGNGIATLGDVIRYTYRVANNGRVDLQDVEIESVGLTFNGEKARGKPDKTTPDAASIGAGRVAEFIGTYRLTQADINNAAGLADAVVHTAIATGSYWPTPDEKHTLSSNAGVVAISIPGGVGLLEMHKTADRSYIQSGDPVSFVISLANNNDAPILDVQIMDVLPIGFQLEAGKAWIDGAPAKPVIIGRSIHFKDLSVEPGSVLEIRLTANALASITSGTHVNSAFLEDRNGKRLLPAATAEVRVSEDPAFSCGDIIGRVFDDRNRNGYLDAGERGLPGVRLADVEGQLILTDKTGAFHIACAALPAVRRGTNFLVKLDEKTLPTGYVITTERSRVVRLTPGKTTRVNFGAAISQLVNLELEDAAFEPGTYILRQNWLTRIDQLISILERDPSVLLISYHGGPSSRLEARRRLDWVESLINQLWRSRGNPRRLGIKTQVLVQNSGP